MVRAVNSGQSLAESFGCDDCYLSSCFCGRGGGIPALSYAIVANRAGIFNTRIDLSSEVWRWKDNVLTDSGDHVLARVRADVISAGHQNLLIEHNIGAPRFRLRATSSKGNLYTMGQLSLPVNVLHVAGGEERYTLQRVHPFL